MTDAEELKEAQAIASEAASVRAQLGGTSALAELEHLAWRPFSGAVFAMLRQVGNEWILGVPRARMENASFATLSWLYIQCAPQAEVLRTVWKIDLFRSAVLLWSEKEKISAPALTSAESLIAASLAEISAANFEVEPKPGDPPEPDTPPN